MADDERTPDDGSDGGRGGRGVGGFAAGMMFGALIGAGIALLLAPESGERTRRRLPAARAAARRDRRGARAGRGDARGATWRAGGSGSRRVWSARSIGRATPCDVTSCSAILAASSSASRR